MTDSQVELQEALTVLDRKSTKEQRKQAFATAQAAADSGNAQALATLAVFYSYGFDCAIVNEQKVKCVPGAKF